MNKYEIMFIVKTSVEGETLTKVTDELKSAFSAKSTELKDLGQKRLAYPINKEITGYYFLINTEAKSSEIDDFRHKASINENVLRHLIIKLDEE